MLDIAAFIRRSFTNAEQIGDLRWVGPHTQKIAYDEDLHGQHAVFEEESFWFRHRNAVFADLIREFKLQQPLVDMGGGTGIVCKALQKQGFAALNLEPTEFGALQSVRRGVPTVQATMQEAGAAANSLPSVGLFDVLEHIADDAKTLRGIFDALEPGGFLVVAVPAYSWLWSNEDIRAEHCRRYTKNKLVEDLRAVGFDVPFSSYLFCFLVLPVFLLRTVTSMGGRIRRDVPENTERRHVPGRFSRLVVDWMLRTERKRLAKRLTLPFGTSVLAVAQKPLL